MFEPWVRAAMVHHQAGRFADAETLYRQVLERDPRHADALHLLGVLLHQTGRSDDGIAVLQQAIDIKPGEPVFYANLALIYQETNRLSDALRVHDDGLRYQPRHPGLHHGRGSLLRLLKRTEEAIQSYRQALSLDPRRAEVHNELAVSLQESGRRSEAIVHYQEAIRLDPKFANAFNNLGTLRLEEKKPGEAWELLRKAEALAPGDAEIRRNLGQAAFDLGFELLQKERWVESEGWLRQALAYRARWGEPWANLAFVLHEQKRFKDAVQAGRQAVELQPTLPAGHLNLSRALYATDRFEDALAANRHALELRADWPEALTNLGYLQFGLGQLDEAKASFDQALKLADPNTPTGIWAQANRGVVRISQGDAKGWPDYDRRFNTPAFANHVVHRLQNRWDGVPRKGVAVLLVAEQGIGDTIQFIRLAARLKAKGMKVLALVPEKLLPLLRGVPGIDEFFTDDRHLPSYDVYCPLVSLAQYIKPSAAPTNMIPKPDLVEVWKKKLSSYPELKVGIAWQGNPNYNHDRFRSIPLREFAPLAKVPGVRLFSLQKGYGLEQLGGIGFPVVDLGSGLDETTGAFEETAAVLACLDLVITSDSALVHLSGALGRPTWLALSKFPDWRWGRDGDKTPWYPSVTLFRQSEPRHWDDVFARMAAAFPV